MSVSTKTSKTNNGNIKAKKNTFKEYFISIINIYFDFNKIVIRLSWNNNVSVKHRKHSDHLHKLHVGTKYITAELF